MGPKITTFFIVVFIIGVTSCANESRNAPSDAVIIQESYNEWVEAVNAKDITWWSSFLAPDAVFLPPDSRPLETTEDIQAHYIRLFEDPNFKLDCKQSFVKVAESKDMAWSRGNCEATFSTPEGESGHGSTKWAKVWIKQPDGTWKCRLNIWNNNNENN